MQVRGPGHHGEAAGPERQAEAKGVGRSHQPERRRRQQRSHDESNSGRRAPDSRLQHGQPQHQLQILRYENQDAEADEEVDDVNGERCRQHGMPEQAQVEQRVRQAPLPPYKQHAKHQPQDDR